MMHMKNFKEYSPKVNNLGDGVLFLQDEDGQDWYGSQQAFSPETVKIAYNSDGVICSSYSDVSMLWPVDLSVAEIEPSKIPDGFSMDGNWIFDGADIKVRTFTKSEQIALATTKRTNLIALATTVIAPLQDAVDLNDATETEVSKLNAWKAYRISLNRVDTGNPVWPVPPSE